MFGMEHHFYINRIPLPIGGAILYGAMGGISRRSVESRCDVYVIDLSQKEKRFRRTVFSSCHAHAKKSVAVHVQPHTRVNSSHGIV